MNVSIYNNKGMSFLLINSKAQSTQSSNKLLQQNLLTQIYEQIAYHTHKLNRDFLCSYQMKRDEQQMTFLKVQNISLLNEFQLLTTCRISDRRTIEVNLSLLRNGEYFRFANYSRITQVMAFATKYNSNSKGIQIMVHPQIYTFSMSTGTKFSLDYLQTNPSWLIKYITTQIALITKGMMYNIYYVLYLGGQVDRSIFRVAKIQELQIRSHETSIFFNLQKLKNQLIPAKTKNNSHIIFQRSITQFGENDTLPQIVDRSGLRIITKSNENKSINSDKQILNNSLNHFAKYLYQEEGVKSSASNTERLETYAPIRFSKNNLGKDNVQWRFASEQRNCKLFAAQCEVHFLMEKTNLQYKFYEAKVPRTLLKKQCKNSDKAMSQKQILKILQPISSIYLPKYYEILDDSQNYYKNSIVMDLCSQGSAQKYISRNWKYISLQSKALFLKQLIQGMRVLRDKLIVHMDLKYENLLITKNFIIKMIDFGESIIESTIPTTRPGFSLPYTPPEYFQKNNKIDTTYDVYSFGVMMNELLTGKNIYLYKYSSVNRLEKSLKKKTYPSLISLNIQKYLMMFPPEITQIVILIILHCLAPNKEKRLNQDVISIALSLIQNCFKEQAT